MTDPEDRGSRRQSNTSQVKETNDPGQQDGALLANPDDRDSTHERDTPEVAGSTEGNGDMADDEAPKSDDNDNYRHGGSEDPAVAAEEEGVPSLSPEDFDARAFLINVKDLSSNLQSDSYKHIDNSFPAEELKSVVRNVRTTIEGFKIYAAYSQSQLEEVRISMRDIKDRIFKRIQNKGYDPKSAHERKSLEEREMDAKLALLNKEIAKVAEELLRSSQTTVETESAAVVASLVAEQAMEDAKRTQEEYEARRKAEVDARKAEDEQRAAQERRREAEQHKHEEERLKEEARVSRLKKHDEKKTFAWEKWPAVTYDIEAGELDRGIGCVVRGNPSSFRENSVTCEVLDLLNVELQLNDDEELVSNMLRIGPGSGEGQLQEPIYIAVPHFITRAMGASREPLIKMEVKPGCWEELKSNEVTLDEHKDLKFVQAELKEFANVAVIAKFKRDFLHLTKRGSKVASTVDSRVTFTAEKGAFEKAEHFVLQLQPIDTATVTEIKAVSPETKGLLTASAVVSMEWTSKEFPVPVAMTLPCHPNPVKAKKAAAQRAAKEAQRKNPQLQAANADDKKERQRKKAAHAQDDETNEKPSAGVKRWYMGQYGHNDEDENDLLYMVTQHRSGRWQVLDNIAIDQSKLDLLQFRLPFPMHRFMVLRTKTNVEAKEAQKIAEIIENHLNQRMVNVIVRQRSDDLCDIKIHLTTHTKSDKLQRKLDEEGYEDGPKEVKVVPMREGQLLQIGFRGNVKAYEEHAKMNVNLVYNSHLTNALNVSIIEVDKYLQKSYSVYRGFIQLFKKTKIVPKVTKKDEGDAENVQVEYTKELLCEYLISIPKAPEFNRPVVKVPVIIGTDHDAINDDTLRHLAQELGDEWQAVGHFLNVKKVRIQAILRNNLVNDDEGEEARYDMLVSWAKKVPRSVKKVDVLKSALQRAGRNDLALAVEQIGKEESMQEKTNVAE